jgi:HK97 gp10 family phage protein
MSEHDEVIETVTEESTNTEAPAEKFKPERAMHTITTLRAEAKAAAKKRAPVDTGALCNSIQASTPRPKTGVVVAGVEYAPYVELGTFDNLRQPFLLPALRAVLPILRSRLRALGGKLQCAVQNFSLSQLGFSKRSSLTQRLQTSACTTQLRPPMRRFL